MAQCQALPAIILPKMSEYNCGFEWLKGDLEKSEGMEKQEENRNHWRDREHISTQEICLLES